MQTYQGPIFPVILMPPTVHGHEIKLDVDRVIIFSTPYLTKNRGRLVEFFHVLSRIFLYTGRASPWERF